jgi:hypothetical protein
MDYLDGRCVSRGEPASSESPVWTAIVLGATLLSILIAQVSCAWRLLAH